jgi:hypothetical protein
VAARPVDPPALPAAHEPSEPAADGVRHLLGHVARGDACQAAVAAQAARKGLCAARQVERTDELGELTLGRGGAHVVRVREHAVLQEADVARQENAPLGDGAPYELRVARGPVVERVEAKEPQVAGKRAEMHVGDEPRRSQRRRAQAQERRDVESLEHRIDRDPLAATEPVGKAYRDAVHEHEVDLGVRHTKRLDRVFDRRRSLEAISERALAPRGRQEVVQLLVEAELALRHLATFGDGASRSSGRRHALVA